MVELDQALAHPEAMTPPAVRPAITPRPSTVIQEVVRLWAAEHAVTTSLIPGPEARLSIAPHHLRALVRGVLQSMFSAHADWLYIETSCRGGTYVIELRGPSPTRRERTSSFFGRRMRFLDDGAPSAPTASPEQGFSGQRRRFAAAAPSTPSDQLPDGLRRLAARYGGVVQCARWNGLTVRIALRIT